MTEEPAVCCFCFKDVPWYQRVGVIVVPSLGEDEEQGLTCHRRCLVNRLDPRVPLHPDLEIDESQ